MKKNNLTVFVLFSIFVLASCGSKVNKTEVNNKETQSINENNDEKNTEDEGNEEIINTLTLDLSDSERPDILYATMNGEFDSSSYIENVFRIHYALTNVVGLVGCPVEIDLGNSSEAEVIFTLDENSFTEVPIKNMIVLSYDEDTTLFNEIKSEIEEDTVKFNIKKSGCYLLVDKYEWYATWGTILEEYAHDLTYDDIQYNFKVTMPKGILYNCISDYWHYDDGFYYGMMMQNFIQQSNDNINATKFSISLSVYRFPDETDNVDNPRSMVSLDEFVNEVIAEFEKADINSDGYEISDITKESFELNNGKKAYLMTFTTDILNDSNNQSKTYRGYYEYDETSFIVFQYNINSKNYNSEIEQKALDSIKSFRYMSVD